MSAEAEFVAVGVFTRETSEHATGRKRDIGRPHSPQAVPIDTAAQVSQYKWEHGVTDMESDDMSEVMILVPQ
jgi:hypothetical protein